jgi:pimeloyl-ACP methyl ester carboxylesterase
MIKMFGAVAAAAVMAAASQAAGAERPLSVVLVHGAFVDASGWEKVYDRLIKDGYEVLMVENSTATLAGDVAATQQVIKNAKHPVVLVGHSYGGMVITEAGADPKVRKLVYLAAFAPDAGESVESLINEPVAKAAPVPILPPQNGFLIVDPAKFPKQFAADSPLTLTRFMAASQVPWGLTAVQTKIGQVAWKTKPTWFMVTQQDHMIPTAQQREMAARAKAHTVEIASSHAVMLSHPDKVTAFIEQAANASR